MQQGQLKPPTGSTSKATGDVAIVRFRSSNKFRLAVQAEQLSPSSSQGSAYGVWLYTSTSKKRFLGFPDKLVGKAGTLETVTDLKSSTPTFEELLLTRESSDKPTEPGTIVLRGRLKTARS